MEREALKLALEALELNNDEWKSLADSGDAGFWNAEDQDHYRQTNDAITAIKEALAQPAQEPPSEWASIKAILDEYGLQAIDFVADFKAVLAQPEQDGKCKLCVDGCIACDARAQPAQEPVAHVYLFDHDGRPRVAWDNAKGIKIGDKLYTTPPQRPWVGLTDEERQDIALEVPIDAVLITEAKLKERNT